MLQQTYSDEEIKMKLDKKITRLWIVSMQAYE